jgi:hypothetical protein
MTGDERVQGKGESEQTKMSDSVTTLLLLRRRRRCRFRFELRLYSSSLISFAQRGWKEWKMSGGCEARKIEIQLSKNIPLFAHQVKFKILSIIIIFSFSFFFVFVSSHLIFHQFASLSRLLFHYSRTFLCTHCN